MSNIFYVAVIHILLDFTVDNAMLMLLLMFTALIYYLYFIFTLQTYHLFYLAQCLIFGDFTISLKQLSPLFQLFQFKCK